MDQPMDGGIQILKEMRSGILKGSRFYLDFTFLKQVPYSLYLAPQALSKWKNAFVILSCN